MSKPNDISQEAWDAAKDPYERMFRVGEHRNAKVCDNAQGIFARAIMAATLAEREACASLGNELDPDITEPVNAYGDGYVEGFWDSAARFAAAIRNRAQP